MVGDSLKVDTDSLGGSGTISYQWQSGEAEDGSFENINGKTGAAFDADSQYENKWIRVVVTRADNSGSVTSAAVQVKAGENDLKGTVTIPEKTNVGKYITPEIDLDDEDLNSWECKYQWQQSNAKDGVYVNIEGETDSTYEVVVEPGTYIRVVVTYEGHTGNIKSNPCLVEAVGDKEITGFEISSSSPKTVYKGLTFGFFAEIQGENLDYEDQGVTWEVSGNESNETSFSDNTLTVASDEAAAKLTIKATSVFDDSFFDTIEVTVTDYNTKSITITGLTGMSGSVTVNILKSLDPAEDDTLVCNGTGEIADGQVKVLLGIGFSYPPDPWDEDGEFYIQFNYSLPFSFETYVYTADRTLNTSDWDENPKFEFEAGEDVTISFDQFTLIPIGEGGYTFTISGLSSFNDAIAHLEVLEGSEWGADPVAMGYAKITSDSVMVTLADIWNNSTGWTGGDGKYYLKLTIYGDTSSLYVYTDGESLEELEITEWDHYWENAPDFEFTDGTTTFSLNFDKFVPGDDITYGTGGWW